MRKTLTGLIRLCTMGEIMGKTRKKKRGKKNKHKRQGNDMMNKPLNQGVFGLKGSNVPANTGGCGCAVTTPINRTYTRPAPAAPSYWETDIEVQTVNSCGVFSQKVEINVEAKARRKMEMLMKAYDKIEWLAYLVGDKDTNTVTDIVIPKQRVTSVNVYVDEPVDVPIIGVMHSHHDMGNGFSHTDDEYINQNHDISLCITNTKITGQVRMKTECGRFFLADAVVVDYIEGFDGAEFIEEAKKLITRMGYQAGTVYSGRTGKPVQGGVNQHFGNTAGWDEWTGYSEIEDETWDVDSPSGSSIDATKKSRDLLAECEAYKQSIAGQEVDLFYLVEFQMLSALIDSVGTTSFSEWEERAFDNTDNTYTEDYYRLVDEISLFEHELTNQERMALKSLGDILDKLIDLHENEVSKTN